VISRRLIAAAFAALLVPATLHAQAKKPSATDARVVALSRGIYRLTALGDTALLNARIFGDKFQPLAGVPIEWHSEDETIASASPTGAVVAMRNGTTRVWAKSGTDSVFAVVTVEQRAAKLAWNVSNPLIFDAIGATAALRAEQRDTRGNPVRGDFPLTACKLRDEGGSGATSLVAGKLLAKANGAATLACTRGAVKDELKIVVRQVIFAAKVVGGDTVSLATAGDTVRLAVQAFDRLGKPIVDARGSWATLSPDTVDVDPVGGTILGRAMGTGRVTVRFEQAVDTVLVMVLGPLPEGRTMPVLARARPSAPAQSVQAQPSSGGASVGGAAAAVVGGAAPAPSAPVLPPSGSGARPAQSTFLSPRGQTATFASSGAGAGSSAQDSVLISKIIEAGLSSGANAGRTFVLTPMGAQAEYRVLIDSLGSSVVRTTSGTLVGASGEVALARTLHVSGQFLSGTLKATSGTTQFDGSFGDARVDVSYEPLEGFRLLAGYGVRALNRQVNTEQWSIIRTGLEGRFHLFSNHIETIAAFTFNPSSSVTGTADVPSTSLGARAGITYRQSWFTLGVEYMAESIEFSKATLGTTVQRQDRFSALSVRIGGHWGR
jgi:hypothetical protein